MAGFRTRGRTLIGLDFSGAGVHGVQYQFRAGRPELVAEAFEPIEAEAGGESSAAALLAALNRMLDAADFAGSRAVASIPSAQVDIRPVRLPPGAGPAGGDAFESAMLGLARKALPYDPGEAVLDYLAPPGQEDASHPQGAAWLLIASRADAVHRLLAVLRSAGLTCSHLEVAATAAARVIGRGSEASFATVDVGAHATQIFVACGEIPVFSRSIRTGLAPAAEGLAAALKIEREPARRLLTTHGWTPGAAPRAGLEGIEATGVMDPAAISPALYEISVDLVERLAAEVTRSLAYVRKLGLAGDVKEVFVLGRGIPVNLERVLAEKLSMSVRLAGPGVAAGASAPPSTPEQASRVVARGLALREWDE